MSLYILYYTYCISMNTVSSACMNTAARNNPFPSGSWMVSKPFANFLL